MKVAIIAFFLAAASAASALVIPSTCESALRRALDSDAAWRMERLLPDSTRPLVSTGMVSCAASRGIVWDVRHPFPSTVTMTTNSMAFADEDGLRVKPLSELRHYEALRRETDAFLAGDSDAFGNICDVATTFADDGTWTLVFTPRSRDLARLVAKAEITGDTTIRKVVLASADGGTLAISFTDLGRGVHRLWKDSEK